MRREMRRDPGSALENCFRHIVAAKAQSARTSRPRRVGEAEKRRKNRAVTYDESVTKV